MIKLQQDSEDHKLYLIVAGGDGTLMYIVDDAVEEGLQLESMAGLCMLPYGTANDLGG